jgi:hypothetical protein
LHDILEDEDMEVQIAWEENSLASLVVLKEGAIVAP